MAEITLRKKNGASTTEIPNQFIDEYMTNANGEFVKIYLYLLRCILIFCMELYTALSFMTAR